MQLKARYPRLFLGAEYPKQPDLTGLSWRNEDVISRRYELAPR